VWVVTAIRCTPDVKEPGNGSLKQGPCAVSGLDWSRKRLTAYRHSEYEITGVGISGRATIQWNDGHNQPRLAVLTLYGILLYQTSLLAARAIRRSG